MVQLPLRPLTPDVSDLISHFYLDAEDLNDHIVVRRPDPRVRNGKIEEHWNWTRHIGQGSFGLVSLYQHANNDQVWAVKKIEPSAQHGKSLDACYRNELYALARLTNDHDHFVQFFGWFSDQQSLYLSMEYFPNKDLGHCIKHVTQGVIAESEVQSIAQQLLEGIEFYQRLGITHRDLRPENIFVAAISPAWWVKIGDFGIGKRIADGSTILHSVVGNPRYMAPEILDEDNLDGYTDAVDIWSSGCVLYYALTSHPPFDSAKVIKQYARGELGFPMQFLVSQGISVVGIMFLQSLLAVNAGHRLSARQALDSPWISDLAQLEPSASSEVRFDTDIVGVDDDHSKLTMNTNIEPTGVTTLNADISAPTELPVRATETKIVIEPPSPVEDRSKSSSSAGILRTPEQQINLENHKSAAQNLKTNAAYEKNISKTLYSAAETGQLQTVEILLDHGANVNAANQSASGATPVCIASQNGHETTVQLLIERGADLNVREERLWTPLLNAALRGHDKVVELLLSKGSDPLAINMDHATALHLAAQGGHSKTISVLLDHGAPIDPITDKGKTPLHWAAANGHTESVQLLLARGANSLACDNNGWNVIHFAANKGHGGTVNFFLEFGINVNSATKLACTALHFAARCGSKETLQILLAHGGDLFALDKDNWNAVHFAAMNGHADMVAFMLDQGLDVNARTTDDRVPLHMAAEYGHLATIELLLGRGADLSAINENDWNAVHLAARYGHVKTVEFLLEQGLDVNSTSKKGYTPLLLAAEYGHIKVVQSLLDRNEGLPTPNLDGLDAVQLAARFGHLETVQLLLDRGHKMSVKAKSGKTPLLFAALNGHTTVVQLLLDRGANLFDLDTENWNAVHLAARNGHKETVELLLDKGLDLSAKVEHSKTALRYAAQYGHTTTVQLLLDRGAEIEDLSDSGLTALAYAAWNGHVKTMRCLVERGASLSIVSKYGYTLLHFATESGDCEAVQFLLDQGLDRHAKNNADKIPAQSASSKGKSDAVVASTRSESFKAALIGQSRRRYSQPWGSSRA